MVSMLRNKIYLFDKWLNGKILIVLLLLVLSTTMINFESTMFYGIFLLLIICGYVIFIKTKIIGGDWKFDKTLYNLPVVNETIIISKDFYWDGSAKNFHAPTMYSKPNTIYIKKGTEFKIKIVKEIADSWSLLLENSDNTITLDYLGYRRYFKTKSDIREEKLNKILK
jgi:hypothetical protein